jgi:hypothetical protein
MNGPAERFEDHLWKQPGYVRRDCQPHRGDVLLLLARISLVCGALSLLLFFPAFLSLPLAGAVMVMAPRDLEMMGRGLMDPAGEEQTLAAYKLALGGVAASSVALVSLGPLVMLNLIALFFPHF